MSTGAPNTILRRSPEAAAAASPSARPLRVLHLSAGKVYGGVETLISTMARFRDAAPVLDHQFAVCYRGRLSKELSDLGVVVHDLGEARLSRPWSVRRARARLGELLKSERIDVVVSHMSWPMAVFGGEIRKSGAGIIFWAHGFQTGKTMLERLAGRHNPDLAISNSQFTAGSVGNLYPAAENRVMHYPVALTETPEAGEWRSKLRRELGVDDRTAVII